MSTALPSTPDKDLSIAPVIWGAIGDKCRARVNLLRRLCEQCAKLGHGEKREGFKRIAASAGMDHEKGVAVISGETLRKTFYQWATQGEVVLIDHTLCRGKCGQKECGNVARQSQLPKALIDEWVRRSLINRRVTKPTFATTTFRQGWRSIIESLVKGEDLPGVGTWKDVYKAEHGREPKGRCTYNHGKPPYGWTYQNFLNFKPKKSVIAMAQRGLSAARLCLPEVRLDLSQLKPLCFVTIDDKRVDALSYGKYAGKWQRCEVWLLVIMDLATRRVVWACLYPKFKREDGTTTGIRRRDVQCCFAYLLNTFGFPKEGMIILAENASAAITAEFEAILKRISGGRITVRRTGMMHGSVMVGGFTENAGNPGAKGWLESFFGHRLDIVLGSIKGQIGSNYMLKPGDADGRNVAAEKIMKTTAELATPAQLSKLMPLQNLPMMKQFILDAFASIAERHDHEMEGFEEQVFWRFSVKESEWRPLHELAEVVPNPAVADALLAQDGCVWQRMESSLERWARTYNAADFQTLTPAAFIDMMMDAATAEYSGNNTLRVKVGKVTYEFRGHQHAAEARQMITVRFSEDYPELGGWLMDSQGSYLGHMAYSPRTELHDRAGLERQLGEREKGLAALYGEVRELMQPARVLKAQIVDVTERESVLRTVMEEAATDGRLSESDYTSEALAAAVAGDEEGAQQITRRGLRSAGRKTPRGMSKGTGPDIDAVEREQAHLARAAEQVKPGFGWMK